MMTLLLKSPEPVSVEKFSTLLDISRRTVFRELETADRVLKSYNINLSTKSGKGMVLEGRPEDKNELREALEKSGKTEPSGRQERHIQLLLELLEDAKPQKLYYYAHKLGVSESTISNDLNIIEPWLNGFRVKLIRKQGYGVYAQGGEIDFRRALMSVMAMKLNGAPVESIYLENDITEVFNRLAHELWRICAWMTPESKENLRLYLLITVHRLKRGREIESGDKSDEYWTMAENVAELFHKWFDLKLSMFEISRISFELSICRVNITYVPTADDNKDFQLKKLAFKMIEMYDPAISAALKLDETLINGLVFHLRSAIVRLESHTVLHDPMFDQIMERYPSVIEKSAKAAQIITGEDGWMPESEVSFLAMHFGAAVHRLQDRKINKRKVKIGVLCVNGIGASYLLAAQIRKYFDSCAEIEVTDLDDCVNGDRYRLLISAVPVEGANIPVIITPPYIDDRTIREIREALDKISDSTATERVEDSAEESLPLICRKLREICDDIGTLIERFSIVPIENDCDFDRLVKLAGYRFGDSEENGRMIYASLTARERISTQVIPEMGFVLLHSQTEGVADPVLSLIAPNDGRFENPYFKDTQVSVIMLLPRNSSLERKQMMGEISSAFVDNEDLMTAVLNCDRDKIILYLENVLKDYLKLFLRGL
jgi:mannitol operon transcriptional antiterminator